MSVGIPVAAMPPVPAMHEHHQRAREQDQPGKPTKGVGAVLGDEKEGTDPRNAIVTKPVFERQKLACGGASPPWGECPGS